MNYLRSFGKGASGSVTMKLMRDNSFERRYESLHERNLLFRRTSFANHVDVLPDEKLSLYEEIFYLLLFSEEPISKEQIARLLKIKFRQVSDFVYFWNTNSHFHLIQCRKRYHVYLKVVSLSNFDKQLSDYVKQNNIARQSKEWHSNADGHIR